jgi:hypothetical protein
VVALDRGARDAGRVSHLVKALFAKRAQLKLVGEDPTQKLTPVGRRRSSSCECSSASLSASFSQPSITSTCSRQ